MGKPRTREGRHFNDQCLFLSVSELAKAGWFAAGLHSGDVELLSAPCGEYAGLAATVAVTLEDRGQIAVDVPAAEGSAGLRLSWPRPTVIDLHRRPRKPRGFLWSFSCPECQRPVRRLFVPTSPVGIRASWKCRLCWRILYRDPRPGRDDRSFALDQLAGLAEIERDLATLKAMAIQSLPTDHRLRRRATPRPG